MFIVQSFGQFLPAVFAVVASASTIHVRGSERGSEQGSELGSDLGSELSSTLGSEPSEVHVIRE